MTIYDQINKSIPDNVNFYMGYGIEIAKDFALKKDNSTKFPAIILNPEFKETQKDKYYKEYDFTFYICFQTSKGLTYKDREDQIFNAQIMPILEEFKANLAINNSVKTSGFFETESVRLPFTSLDGMNNYIVDILQVDFKNIQFWV